MSPFRRMFRWTPLDVGTVLFITATHVLVVWLGGRWGYLVGALLWPALMCLVNATDPSRDAPPVLKLPPNNPALPSTFGGRRMCKVMAVYPDLKLQRCIGGAVWGPSADVDTAYTHWLRQLERSDIAERKARGDVAVCFYLTEIEPAPVEE